jgi:hypothetical protein
VLWEKRTPGAVWGVNVSGDGRWVVAALGDGSVRWYRASDGQEQLALFVHGDHERWIAWTPTGYYDTSMGGENLVGWHVNRAFNQSADFFSVGRFRERFYQPSRDSERLCNSPTSRRGCARLQGRNGAA